MPLPPLSSLPIDDEEKALLGSLKETKCPDCGEPGRAARMDANQLAAVNMANTVKPEDLAHLHGKLYHITRLICWNCNRTYAY